MPIRHVLFRVDAGARTGMGHVMRCRTVALALKKRTRVRVSFLSAEIPIGFQEALEAEGIEVLAIPDSAVSAEGSIASMIEAPAETALVVDSFNPDFYDTVFQQTMLEQVARLVFIAFDNAPHYFSHILHNQNPLSRTLEFSCEPYTRCLLGLDHVILQERIRQLARAKQTKRDRKSSPVALLSFGGSDPTNLTTRTVRALAQSGSACHTLVVVLGSLFTDDEALSAAIADSTLEVTLKRNVTDMAGLMQNCDLAFTSGGLTTWELGALGVPVIILPAGERESMSARHLHEHGMATCVEPVAEEDVSQLADRLSLALRDGIREKAHRLRSEINPDGVENLVDGILDVT